MTNFRDFLLLQESLTRKTNYTKLDEKYINMFNQVLDTKKYLQIALFKVDDKQYYCILVMKDSKLEPHFGVFYENKFNGIGRYFQMEGGVFVEKYKGQWKNNKKNGFGIEYLDKDTYEGEFIDDILFLCL